MFDTKEDLFELALAHDVHRCLLPDRFLLDNSKDKVWPYLLGGKSAVRDLGERLRKCAQIERVPREMRRRASDSEIITMLMMSHESRSLLVMTGVISREEWYDIVYTAQSKALVNKSPDLKEWPLKLNLYKFDLSRGTVDKAALDLIRPYLDVEFYRSLAPFERDCADFVINVSICNLMSTDIGFVSDFIERCSHLFERQKAFLMGINRAIKEGDFEKESFNILNPPKDMSYEHFFGLILADLCNNLPKNGGNLSLNALINNAERILTLASHETHGIIPAMRNRLKAEEEAIIKSLNSLNDEVSDSGLSIDNESWADALAASKNIGEVPDFPPLTKELLSILHDFVCNRSNACSHVSNDKTFFTGPLRALKETKALMNAELLNSSSDVNKLKGLMDSLATESQNFQSAADAIGTMNCSVLGLSQKLREQLKDLNPAMVVQEDISEPAVDPEVHNEMSAELTLLQAELKKLTEKLAEEVSSRELKEKQIEHMSEEMSEIREANHKLKNRLSFQESSSESDEVEIPLSFDLFKRILIGGEPKLIEVLTFFEAEAADRLVVLPSAKKSALEADDFLHGKRLADLVNRLIYPYLDALKSGKPDAEARKIFGKNFAAKESQGVEQSRALRAQRQFEYNGKLHYFQRHLGIGKSYGTANTVRLYFEVIDEKVVIAYCGEHLESMQTN